MNTIMETLPSELLPYCFSYLSHTDLAHLARAGKAPHRWIARALVFERSTTSFENITLLGSLSCELPESSWKRVALQRNRKRRKRQTKHDTLTWKHSARYFGGHKHSCRSCGASTPFRIQRHPLCMTCQHNPSRKYAHHVLQWVALWHFDRAVVDAVVPEEHWSGARYSWFDLTSKASALD
jgi:hypothetical protein